MFLSGRSSWGQASCINRLFGNPEKLACIDAENRLISMGKQPMDAKRSFAHNGQVPEVVAPQGCCHPRHSPPGGETDSEHAFIYLLEEIAGTFPDTSQSAPSETMDAWFETLMTRSTAIAAYGQFNFLMSDGEHLIAYGHDRLHSQQRMEGDVRSVVVASVPLTHDESWGAFAPGELRVYRGGQLLGRWCAGMTKPCPRAIASP